MLIHPIGGKGTGVEANGSNFPFTEPGPDIRGLLADLWLSHEYRDVVLPLRVGRMAGFQQAFDGLASAAEIEIVDAAGAAVFDSAGASYNWKDWGERLRIHEWLFAGSVCRAVQHRATSEPHDPWPAEIYPANGVLDERTSELMPERLLILSEKSGGAAVSGEITFVCGWNVNIAAAPYRESVRNATALTFEADPGDGMGRYPGCRDPELLIRKIGGAGPDDRGNFLLAADDCYYVRRPVQIVNGLAVPALSTLELGNDCGPCCDCDDFVNVQRAILNVESKLRAAAATAEATRDEFIVAKDRWISEKECREQQAVKPLATTAAGTYADINITVCNPTSKCIVDLRLDFTVATTTPGSWVVMPGTTYISVTGRVAMAPYKMEGAAGGTLTAYFDAINPMTAGRLRTRLGWPSPRPEGTILTVTATATPITISHPLFPQTGVYTTLMT